MTVIVALLSNGTALLPGMAVNLLCCLVPVSPRDIVHALFTWIYLPESAAHHFHKLMKTNKTLHFFFFFLYKYICILHFQVFLSVI